MTSWKCCQFNTEQLFSKFLRRTFSVCPCVRQSHIKIVMSFLLYLPAGHSLTWNVFLGWRSFQLLSRLLFQTWYELVCRKSSANFRLSRWKPHFSGTNIGAMLTKREKADAQDAGSLRHFRRRRQVSKLASKQLYLSRYIFCERILRLEKFPSKRSVILKVILLLDTSRSVNVFV